MDNINQVTVDLSLSNKVITDALCQYDYGQEIVITGATMPTTFEAQFSKGGPAKTQLGSSNVVAIPDEYLLTPGNIEVYIFLHNTEDDGSTEFFITIPVKGRPVPSDAVPTAVEQSVITQAIAALNAAVTESAASAQAAAGSAESAAGSATSAGNSATSAEQSKNAAAGSATAAAGSADSAAQSKNAAAQSATSAGNSATSAEQSKNAAAGSATAAAGSADSAAQSKNAAAQSATSAGNSATSAEQSKNAAAGSAQAAAGSAGDAAAASQAVQDMSVSASTLAPGAPATATKTVDPSTGQVNITFGIPKGQTGDSVGCLLIDETTSELYIWEEE